MNPYANIMKDKGIFFPKDKKENPKPALDSSNDQLRLKKNNASSLKHAFLISVIGDDYNSSITVHHPIGQTRLDPSDWVMTPSNEVHHLLARAEDKSALEETLAKRKQYVREMQISSGIITENEEGKTCYRERPDKCRDDLLKPFKDKQKEAEKLLNEEHQLAIKGFLAAKEAEHKARFPTRPFKPPKNLNELIKKEKPLPLLHFITDKEIKALETAYEDSRAEYSKEASKKFEIPFVETVGGVRADIYQQPTPALRGKSQKQAIDLVIQTMMQISSLPVGDHTVKVGTRPASQKMGPAWSEEYAEEWT